jgi:DNA-binding response OmpR family regulator
MKYYSNKVIIVDDDPDDREFIEDAFREVLSGEENIHAFGTGDQLLENMKGFGREELPGMILLDLNMPGKDGNSILTELKANQSYSHIPIIILTTSSSVRDRDKCYHMGANCFVTKPHSYKEMVELVRTLVHLWMPAQGYF